MSGQLEPNRARAWLDGHWRSVGLGVLGLLLGGSIGWWAGSWTACGERCEPNTSAIEALGTWVGGLGTIAAVGFAVIAFRAEEASRRREEANRAARELRERHEQEREAKARRERRTYESLKDFERAAKAANKVTAYCQWGGHNGHHTDAIRFRFTNELSETPVYDVRAEHDTFGKLGSPIHTLVPGETRTHEIRGLSLVNGKLIGIPDDQSHWESEQSKGITVSFTVNNRRFQRVGGGAAEFVEDVSVV